MNFIEDHAFRLDQKLAVFILALCGKITDHAAAERVDRRNIGRRQRRDLLTDIFSRFFIFGLRKLLAETLVELGTHVGRRGICKCHDENMLDRQFPIEDPLDDPLCHDCRLT